VWDDHADPFHELSATLVGWRLRPARSSMAAGGRGIKSDRRVTEANFNPQPATSVALPRAYRPARQSHSGSVDSDPSALALRRIEGRAGEGSTEPGRTCRRGRRTYGASPNRLEIGIGRGLRGELRIQSQRAAAVCEGPVLVPRSER